MSSLACPSCGKPMQAERYASRLQGELELDFCDDCHLIWLDHLESSQLGNEAVVRLFERLHRQADPVAHRSVAGRPACPRCRQLLCDTHDLVRSNRIRYLRCPQGHGRLIAYWQFLREKQFVRDLTAVERARLKPEFAQACCHDCGAPVDLRLDQACNYCRAPLSVLDKEAVRQALQQYRQAPAPSPALAERPNRPSTSVQTPNQVQGTLSALEFGWDVLSEFFDKW